MRRERIPAPVERTEPTGAGDQEALRSELERLKQDKAETEAKLAETRRKLLFRIEQNAELKRDLAARQPELEALRAELKGIREALSRSVEERRLAQEELDRWAALSRSRSYRAARAYTRLGQMPVLGDARRALGRLLRALRLR